MAVTMRRPTTDSADDSIRSPAASVLAFLAGPPRPPLLPHWLSAPLRFPACQLLWLPPLAIILLDAVAPILPGLLGGFVLLLATIGLWLWLLSMASRLLLGQLEDRQGRAVDLLDAPAGVGLGHVLLWLIASLLLLAAAVVSGWMLALSALVLLLVMPAATLLLSRDGRLSEALHPPAWAALAAQLGRADYARLSLMLALAAASYLLLAALIQPLPVGLRNALSLLCWGYATLAWFALAGQTLACHQPAAPAAPTAPIPNDLDAEWAELMRHGASLERQRRLATGLALAGDRDRRLEHGRVFVAALLEGFDRPAEALEQTAALLALDPDFSLARPSSMLALIEAAEREAPPALALRLCRNFLQAFPAAPRAVDVRRIAARVIDRKSTAAG